MIPPHTAATADIRRQLVFNCGQRVAVSDDGARATIDNGARNRSSSCRWCTTDFDPLSVLDRPATAAGSDACSQRVQGTRPRPRSKSATWPCVELVRNTVLIVRRCAHGGGLFRFISTNAVVVARSRSPRKFFVIFISRIGSGAACSAGNGNCARHHIVANYKPKKKTDHDKWYSATGEDKTWQDKTRSRTQRDTFLACAVETHVKNSQEHSRAAWFENLQEKCRAPERAQNTTHILREPAHRKRMSRFHRSHFMWKSTGKLLSKNFWEVCLVLIYID